MFKFYCELCHNLSAYLRLWCLSHFYMTVLYSGCMRFFCIFCFPVKVKDDYFYLEIYLYKMMQTDCAEQIIIGSTLLKQLTGFCYLY